MTKRYFQLLEVKGSAPEVKEVTKLIKQFFKDEGWGNAEIIGEDDGELIVEFVNAEADIPELCRRLSYRFASILFKFEYTNGDLSGGFVEVKVGETRDLETYSWKCDDCESFISSDPQVFYCDDCGEYVCPDCSAGAGEDHDDH